MTITHEHLTDTTVLKLYRMSTPDHNCPWGLKAINLLQEQGIPFEDIKLTSQDEVASFKMKYQVATTPQIFRGETMIGGYTDLAKMLAVEPEKADYSYTPVIALFSTAGLITLSTSLGLTGLMGISLSMLASLKLMDIESFANSFEKYDLITKKCKAYGRVYPFIELILGLGYLSGIAPLATGIVSFLVGISGTASVFKAVYIDKLSLNCACIGGNSKAPLGIISFSENAIMALMGVSLLFSSFGKPSLNTGEINDSLMSYRIEAVTLKAN
ncbi:MauE/DoxX family redox-associated membrane protein [Synechocystis sp. PCC 6714]|uniref:MauE/DoxX family redox-associated membrane protein n=2 Tax=unclassified Synechocystis TaxID=2640012 RepID=UPI00048B64C1|nr:glutaredoxin [Synechocystis sp. PCC 6714]MCT0254676.1 glutaredoxin [Synechocystis sp. CS-94]